MRRFAALHQQQRAGLRTAVLTEIAMNHRNNLRAEVVAGDYAEIASAVGNAHSPIYWHCPTPGSGCVWHHNYVESLRLVNRAKKQPGLLPPMQ